MTENRPKSRRDKFIFITKCVIPDGGGASWTGKRHTDAHVSRSLRFPPPFLFWTSTLRRLGVGRHARTAGRSSKPSIDQFASVNNPCRYLKVVGGLFIYYYYHHYRCFLLVFWRLLLPSRRYTHPSSRHCWYLPGKRLKSCN